MTIASLWASLAVNMNSVAHELKTNLQLLMEEDILLVLKPVLSLKGEEQLQAAATRIIWNFAHDTKVKLLLLNDADIIGVLYTLPLPELNMATHCALWLLGLQTNGMFMDITIYILYAHTEESGITVS